MNNKVLLATKKKTLSSFFKTFLRSKGVPIKFASTFHDLSTYIENKSKELSLLVLDSDLPGVDEDKFLFSVYKRAQKELPIFYIFEHKKSVKKELLTNLHIHQIFEYSLNKNYLTKIAEDIIDVVKPNADKRFKSVSYLEEDGVFACLFVNGHKFFLDRRLLQEDDGSKIKDICLKQSGYSFLVRLASGKEYEVPWDFVRYHCDVEYRKSVTATKPFSTIAERIKENRESLGKTQEEIAKATGIKRPNIARIESGKHEPTLETLKKLADALGIPVVDFF